MRSQNSKMGDSSRDLGNNIYRMSDYYIINDQGKDYYFTGEFSIESADSTIVHNEIQVPDSVLGYSTNADLIDNYSQFFGLSKYESDLIVDTNYSLNYQDMSLTDDFDDDIDESDHDDDDLIVENSELEATIYDPLIHNYLLENHHDMAEFNINMDIHNDYAKLVGDIYLEDNEDLRYDVSSEYSEDEQFDYDSELHDNLLADNSDFDDNDESLDEYDREDGDSFYEYFGDSNNWFRTEDDEEEDIIEMSEHYVSAVNKVDNILTHEMVGDNRNSNYTNDVYELLDRMVGTNTTLYGADSSDDIDTHTLPFNIKLENTIKYWDNNVLGLDLALSNASTNGSVASFTASPMLLLMPKNSLPASSILLSKNRSVENLSSQSIDNIVVIRGSELLDTSQYS